MEITIKSSPHPCLDEILDERSTSHISIRYPLSKIGLSTIEDGSLTVKDLLLEGILSLHFGKLEST